MRNSKRQFLAAFSLAVLLLLSACQTGAVPQTEIPSAPLPSSSSAASQKEMESSAPSASVANTIPCFFQQLAKEKVGLLGLTGRESAYEKVQAAFRYVVTNTHYLAYDNPTLTESWRYLDFCGTAPTAYQVAGFSPLHYGWGSCENYAAALMVLLEELGFETVYVTGQTFSVSGTLVDHAWLMVKIEENWYHVDPQLEDNVIKGGMLTYRYFLKSDEEFSAHHVWGTRLTMPDPYSLTLPACNFSAPAPAPEHIEKPSPPSINQLLATIQQLKEKTKSPSAANIEPLPPFPSIYQLENTP